MAEDRPRDGAGQRALERAGRHVGRFVAAQVDRRQALPITGLSGGLAELPGIKAFEISPARN